MIETFFFVTEDAVSLPKCQRTCTADEPNSYSNGALASAGVDLSSATQVSSSPPALQKDQSTLSFPTPIDWVYECKTTIDSSGGLRSLALAL